MKSVSEYVTKFSPTSFEKRIFEYMANYVSMKMVFYQKKQHRSTQYIYKKYTHHLNVFCYKVFV